MLQWTWDPDYAAKPNVKTFNYGTGVALVTPFKKDQSIDFAALETFLINNEIGILNINIKHVEILSSLPFIHRDPFDRILIAQCMVEKTVLLTKDESINLYQTIETIW